jgi:hypothetical protein
VEKGRAGEGTGKQGTGVTGAGRGPHDSSIAEKPVAPPTEVKDKVYLKLKGEEDRSGRSAKRLTLSPAESGGEAAEQAPVTGVDAGARLSEEQAEEDAVESAPVPSEYQEIIKRINTEKK